MKKIAVFLGDFFWSSIPYDGIRLLNLLQEEYDVDLLMFERDIRLNKKFLGKEKYFFNVDVFKNSKNLKTIKNWEELYKVSKDYKLIITSTHIAPKTRYPYDLKKNIQCPIAAWDIGGTDILTNAIIFATFYFVKGPIWKNWLRDKNVKQENIFVTGSPHYDEYVIDSYKSENKLNFYNKYSLKNNAKTLLVCPSNPGSHKEQFEQNIIELRKLITFSKGLDLNFLLKTYPHDYVFYENVFDLSGVYKRVYNNKPHYEFLKNEFPELIVVESQDHHKAIMFSDAMYNMSGSHVAWETHFSKCKSYSTNYKDKNYYGSVHYLKGVKMPDDIYNTHIDDITDIQMCGKEVTQDNDYIITTNSIKNIVQKIKELQL